MAETTKKVSKKDAKNFMAHRLIEAAKQINKITMKDVNIVIDELGLNGDQQDELFDNLEKLGIEGEYEGIGNCIVGYADVEPTAKPRRENRVYYIE